MITTNKILRKIGCKNLSLHKGEGYWYFTFDDGQRFLERSVYVFRLNDLSIDDWTQEGLQLIGSATLNGG